MKKMLIIVTLIILPLAIASCNTVRGVGEDISGASTATQKVLR